MMIKRKLIYIFLLQFVVLFNYCYAEQVCDKIIITGPPQSPPGSWVVDGRLKGASVDFFRQMSLEAGIKTVEFKVYDSWLLALEATRRGEVDMIFSAAWSAEREQFLQFVHPPYASQFLYVVVRAGDSFRLNKYEDLIGRKGAAGQGEAYGDSKFGQLVRNKLTLTRTANIGESMKLLVDGSVDFVLGYEYSVFSEVLSRNLAGKVEYVQTYPYETDVYLAFSRRSRCAEALVPKFSELIRNQSKNKTYFNLISKYKNIFNLELNVTKN